VGVERTWDAQRFRERLGQGREGRTLRRIRGATLFAESVVGVNGRLDDQTRTQFYGNHSLRMLDEDLVLAFNRALDEAT
jgi:hypothetical protein